jgi:hypothetical protein
MEGADDGEDREEDGDGGARALPDRLLHARDARRDRGVVGRAREIPEDDNEDCVVSVRVRWDSVEDEVKYSADLRRHIALLNQDATQEAEVYYGFNHAEYAWWSCPHDLLDMHLGSTFIIRTGPE